MIRKILPVFLILLMVVIYNGCGSTVSESSGNNTDVTLLDINVADVIKDSTGHTDTYSDGEISDVIIRDEISIVDVPSDISVTPDGEVVDGSVEDTVTADGEFIDEGSEDVVSIDGGTDVSPTDAGAVYCKVGDEKLFTCPSGSTVVECVCEYKGCMPKCDKIGTKSEGWYDCDGNLIRFAICKDCKVFCDSYGTRSEGWYSDCDGLISYDNCAPEYKCVDDPLSLCKTYCKDPCDCPQDKPLCVNGICDDPVLVGCNNNNNLCPCGSYCVGNLCAEGNSKCTTSCDCKVNQICVNGVCKDKSTSDCKNEPCPCGQHCVKGQFQYTCQKGCETNCDCPEDNPICINGNCGRLPTPNCGNDDRNCPCMEVCVNGTCQKATDVCDSSCDCKDPTKPSCINMICSKIPDKCVSDKECPCEQSCVEGVCKEVTRCLDACDCNEKEICKGNICTPKSDNACFDNNDCPCNYLCQNFQCVLAQRCKFSCDCPQMQNPPLICKNNLCQPRTTNRCIIDNDCPCGNYCSNNGFCVLGCNDGCDCPAETPYCVSGKCSPVLLNGCTKNSECRCGEVCQNSKCVTP
ncbi:MAG: hypothetical protein ACP5QK_08295 [Myxococcota bacterium]